MTRYERYGRHDRTRRERSPAVPSSRRRPTGGGAGRPVLTLVRGSASDCAPVELATLTRSAMPADVRGAVVTPVQGRLMATWMPLSGPSRIPQGRVLVAWTPAGEDRTDITAHLGLAGAQVLLAVWPGLRGDWSGVVHPTVAEVTELHGALRLATLALERLAD
ncbi:hypothetical protein ACIPSE_39425 [Streptomyces sp. NPDC090106]|uniref:hypothetical protein n=1 Tax=Streptomyces sp. NPDC090106 TaxID=3365946 RepID=UPI003809A4DB